MLHPQHNAPPHRLRFSFHISAVITLLLLTPLAFAADRGWNYQPYRIHAMLAIDAPGGLSQQLARELPQHLQDRVHAAIGPLWSFDIELATGTLRHDVFSKVAFSEAAKADDDLQAEFPAESEKLLLLTVRWAPDGFELIAREFDRYVERWSMPIRTRCRQEQALSEQLFAIAWQAVAPLVQLELDPNDEQRVRLMPRGAALVRSSSDATSLKPGDVLLPILRRTTRDGEVVEGGIQVVPWTYVEVAEIDGQKNVARIHSANRRPFGVRRQGRVEQVAIGIRAQPAETVVRLHSRTAPDKPLVGYQVFSPVGAWGSATAMPQMDGNLGRRGLLPSHPDGIMQLGSTDGEGMLAIPPGETRIRTLYLKNGGQLLARLPIVPGAEPQIDVPLPDDDPRLAAEARLAALREELIDVVARRNILMARTRQKINESEFAAAQKLLAEADRLPGRSQFNLTLTTAARTLRSKDPQIQRRIDQLVEATQTVMNQFLDLRPVTQLHNELRAAQQ